MADPVSRRGVLAGATAVGALALTGCGGSSDTKSTTAQPSDTPASAAGPSAPAASAAGGPALAKLADITVGSAVAARDPSGQPLVVARPSDTTAVAFSAICTHQGCTVKPAGAELQCPCHGSRYAAITGKVLQGPATSPLPSVPVKVSGGEVLPA